VLWTTSGADNSLGIGCSESTHPHCARSTNWTSIISKASKTTMIASMMSHHVTTLAAVAISLLAEASPGSALVAETTSPRGGVRAGPDVPAGYTTFEGDCPGNNIVILRPPQVRSGRALFTAVHGAPLLCVSHLSCYDCYICHHYRQWHGHSLVLHSPSQLCAWPLDPRRAPAHVT
jgi:hypothetical protein